MPGARLRLTGRLDDEEGIAVALGFGACVEAVGKFVKTEGIPTSLDDTTVGNCVNVAGRMVALLGATERLEGAIVELAIGLGAVVVVIFGMGALVDRDGAEVDDDFVDGDMV